MLIFSLLMSCNSSTKNKNPFGYTYHVDQQITFDYSKSYSIPIGTILVQNKTNWKKKFRYHEANPKGYFFNTKTSTIHYVNFVTHSNTPRKMDFNNLGWLIGIPGYFIPVKDSITLKVYINLNRFPKPGPAELVRYVRENKKDLEYHIFNPENYPEPKISSSYPITKQETYAKPDWIIKEIRVINSHPHTKYQYQ